MASSKDGESCSRVLLWQLTYCQAKFSVTGHTFFESRHLITSTESRPIREAEQWRVVAYGDCLRRSPIRLLRSPSRRHCAGREGERICISGSNHTESARIWLMTQGTSQSWRPPKEKWIERLTFFFLKRSSLFLLLFLPADDINKWIALLPIEQVERSLVDVNIGEKDRKMANRRDTVAKKCHRNGVSFVAALWQAEIT